jgi:uncharacterized protein YndB with AHSA1/START domain
MTAWTNSRALPKTNNAAKDRAVAVSEIDSIICETTIAATPETVFAFFTDPDLYVRWMGAHALLDPRPGGAYAVDINTLSRARGTFVEVVPYSRILFTFGWEGDDQPLPPGASMVEVTFTAVPDGTHVRLQHHGLLQIEARHQHQEGWLLYLARLTTAAAGGEPGPDPNANPPDGGVIH